MRNLALAFFFMPTHTHMQGRAEGMSSKIWIEWNMNEIQHWKIYYNTILKFSLTDLWPVILRKFLHWWGNFILGTSETMKYRRRLAWVINSLFESLLDSTAVYKMMWLKYENKYMKCCLMIQRLTVELPCKPCNRSNNYVRLGRIAHPFPLLRGLQFFMQCDCLSGHSALASLTLIFESWITSLTSLILKTTIRNMCSLFPTEHRTLELYQSFLTVSSVFQNSKLKITITNILCVTSAWPSDCFPTLSPVFLLDTRRAGRWLRLWTGGLWHSQQDQCPDWRWSTYCWTERPGKWMFTSPPCYNLSV